MAEGGSLPILPGVGGLERALTRRDPARIVSALAQWELRRVWAHKVACAILEEDNRALALDARELAWLGSLLVERLLRQQDYSAARQALETYFTSPQAKLHDVMKHEPEAALKHVQTFARLYEQHLQKVDAVREHTRRTGEKRKVTWPPKRFKHLVEPEEELLVKMTVDWAACEYRQLRRIDAICLKCRPFISGVIWPAPVPAAAAAEPESAAAAAAAAVSTPQAGPSRTRSQSQPQGNSQDSLPTPDPSSDGIEIVSAPTPRRQKMTSQQVESAPPQNLRKHERSPSADELVVTEAPEAKRFKMDDDETHSDRQQTDPKPVPLRDVPTESAPGEPQPKREAPVTSSPAPARPQFRDSSVQTSPPPEAPLSKTTSPAPRPPATAAPVERTSPRPRTRSPPLARPAAPPLATLARTMASSSYVNQGLPPSTVDSRQIFSLLQAGAAEQQQRLERERRHASSDGNLANVTSAGRAATPPVQPAASAAMDSPAVVIAESSSPNSAANASTLEPRGGFRNDVDDASAMDCDAPTAEPAEKAEKSATSLGPTSSAILMPPPTAGSRESPTKGDSKSRFRAAPSQGLVPATAEPEAGVAATVVSVETVVDATPTSSTDHSATTASQDPSTQSSDSVVRDSQEQASTQSSSKEGDASFPSAAQVRRDRATSVIFPQPGFTGSTTATVAEDGNVTMDPPPAAQTKVVGTPVPIPSALRSRFLARPSSDHVESTLKDSSGTGSSGRTASTDETKSSQATRPTPLVDESASGKTTFDFASLASQHRQFKREYSEPPLEYRSAPSVSGRVRASSLPPRASQDSPRITSKERSQPSIDKPTAAGPAAPEKHEPAAVAESTAATETDGIASDDDLDSALRTSFSVEEVVQHFDAMEESRQFARKASLPALEAGVTAVAGEAAVAVSSSDSGNTRGVPTEVTSGLEEAPEGEDAIAAADDADQAEALRIKTRVESEAAERRRIAEEKASEGELVDDELDELSEGNDADVGASSYGDFGAALAGEPFSQAALLTQAIDEPGSLEDQASDQDGAVLARRRSFANLEDEAEHSEHEQDEVNKVLNEDMWGYLDLLKRDV
ncbi:hypothetical protein C6P46_001718 [Rhodotorula mucilaginosa]|uniref:Proteophosphoglycan ppg4 n=1 Tax=Rhodotorula mucilaginosa TaxID=5537 RepID=A0A9P6W6Q3_RHOMI|nr:hypothetical protein C6P46_001718 [Rhodotorula mucilaginosa]